MSNMLNDTLKTAKHGIESATEHAEHSVSSGISTLLKGVGAVAGIVATVRSLDSDDALAWFGLERRKSPLRTIAFFGAGIALGAGVGILFAPRSGADTRRTIRRRSEELQHEAKHLITRAGSEVKELGQNAQELAMKAKDAVTHAERKIENKVEAQIAGPSTPNGIYTETKGGGHRLS